MTDDTIPASAVREIIEKHAPYAALDDVLHDVVGDLETLLASAAPTPEEAPSEPVGREAVALHEAAQLLRELLSGLAGDYTVPMHWYWRAKSAAENLRALTDTTDQGEEE